MQLGLIGLGRMGGNMRDRLRAAGHEVVGFDPRPDVTDVESLQALADALEAPRVVWIMVPSGDPTRETVRKLADVLSPGDLVIEGGNSRYTDDGPNAALLDEKGIGYVDCGVSGGIWGKENGYGLMQAYAEGYELMAATDLVTNVTGTMQAWSRGTVVRSWLLDLLVLALKDDPGLAKLSPYVEDSGEGRWTIEEAIRHAVPLPVISSALFARFSSRQESSPAMRAVAALRHQFGGHAVREVGPAGTPGQLAGPTSGTGATPPQP